ncbi:UDP-glycosyltransferase 72E1-like [Senna tora]|uniref:UDP-glycosyltransferase 72E1-like n=1 Tax=Senna tora TaxID=362788 RepID=A0A835CJQ0_9FABA|nr:UDP-glycosyltransferase 72E1-like [Senna tora]
MASLSLIVVTTDTTTTRSHILHHTSHLPSLNLLVLPHVDVSHILGPNPPVVARIILTMLESLPLVRSSILSMNPRPSALIVDLFGTPAFAMARELGMLTYVFLTTNAWFSAVTVYSTVIDKKMEDRHVIHHEPLRIPSCKSIPFEDTFEPFLDRDDPMYEGFLKTAREIVSADGILVNTWQDLEPRSVKALLDRENLGGIVKGAIHFVGPLVRSIESKPNAKNNNVLQWLDEQPGESVIYVSFGSGGTLSEAQLTELAWGLELSQQRFVWVVRPPKEDDSSGTFFDVGNGNGSCNDDIVDYLPEGFQERTRNVGRVVLMWAPQAEILEHPSTGGFVTHCGWNSTLESLQNGVGMVAWPLFAEQRMNARMLTEELKVAVRVNNAMDGSVVSGEKALSKFGSSHESLCLMTKDCLNYLQGPIMKSFGA